MKPASPEIANHPVVRRVTADLMKRFGDRLSHVILFGSRARGDAREGSDWDFLALVRELDEDDRTGLFSIDTAKIRDEIGAEVWVRSKPLPRFAERSLFHHDVRRDGVIVVGEAARVPGRERATTDGPMKPETAKELETARKFVAEADRRLRDGEPAEAERHAYNGALAAARAFIFERTDRAAKTHAGTESEFRRIWRSEGRDLAVADALKEGFLFKQAFDYGDLDDAKAKADRASVGRVAGVFGAVAAALAGEG